MAYLGTKGSGKNRPIITLVELDGEKLEVITKLSHTCEAKERNLIAELICGLLALDLNLPIPMPLLINISDDFVATIRDEELKARLNSSSRLAFGSVSVGSQFSIWQRASVLKPETVPTAVSILAFDGIIQNFDRREANPNCLINGSEIRIFDHELALIHKGVVGYTPPWCTGGYQIFDPPGAHIFKAGLKGKNLDYNNVKGAWSGLAGAGIDAYKDCVPKEWCGFDPWINDALQLIKDATSNIDGCIAEIQRVLK